MSIVINCVRDSCSVCVCVCVSWCVCGCLLGSSKGAQAFMLLSAASATMKPFFVTSIGNVLLNMQSDSVRIDIDIAGSPWPDYYASLVVAMLVTSTSSCWWCWCWCWRWRRRRLRDVTLPTLQAQRDSRRGRANTALSATIFMSRIVMKLGAWPRNGASVRPLPSCTTPLAAAIICKQWKVAATRFNCYAH